MDIKQNKEKGILKTEARARTSEHRAELTPEGSCERPPLSPQPSVDRLSVTWAEPTSMTSGVNLFHLPSETPIINEIKFSSSVGDGSEDEDYSASLNAVLRHRRASVRRSRKGRVRRPSSPFLPEENRSRRRSSVFTTSSGDTAISMEEAQATVVTQEQIFQNIHLHKEVLGSVKQEPLGMRRKLKIVHQAKRYIKRHEGQLQERLAQSKSTRDIYARFNILMATKWQQLKREAANMSNFVIPWELRIKEIESHFGSVVASYFTFLRWLFWVNLVIGFILLVFVIVPEYLTADIEKAGERKIIMEEERVNATNLLTLWEFEGVLKYSPIFYGYYSNVEKTEYRMPLAYFLTGLVVYIYSFVAILRKMAENSRMSKLSEKEDECIFSWKLFTGWDYMIGNTETAHNRIASVILGFKEALLEEAEKKKDLRNWRILFLRTLVNVVVVVLLAGSAYAVVTVVSYSDDDTKVRGWWVENKTTIVVTVISIMFPVVFDLLGLLEHYHPRTQLRLQLGRIMLLNLLNLYSLIFALFSKIDDMSKELDSLKPVINMNATVTSNSTLGFNESLLKRIPMSCSEVRVQCLPCNMIFTIPNKATSTQIFTQNASSTAVPYIIVHGNINESLTLNKLNLENLIKTESKSNENSLNSTDISILIHKELERLRNLSSYLEESTENVESTSDESSDFEFFYEDTSTTVDSSPNDNSSPKMETTTMFDKTITTEYFWDETETVTESYTATVQNTWLSEESTYFTTANENISTKTNTKSTEDNANSEITTLKFDLSSEIITNSDTDSSPTLSTNDFEESKQSTEYDLLSMEDKSTRFQGNTVSDSSSSTMTSENISSISSDFLSTLPTVLIDNTEFTLHDNETYYTSASYTGNSKSTTLNKQSNTFFDNPTTVDPSSQNKITIGSNLPSTNYTTVLKTFELNGSRVICPNTSFNYIVDCGHQNIKQIFFMSECKVVNVVCYIQNCTEKPANNELETNKTNIVRDIVYVNENNISMYNLSKTTRKKLLKLCWETMLGQELIKLTMMDLVFVLLGTLFMDFFRALFVRYMNQCWCWDLEKRFPEYGDFKIAENILHLINNQGMVWMGMFFSPGLVVLNIFKLIIIMYLRSWAVMTCNVPHEVIFRVSKSNNFYLALLLTMLFLCVLPVGYSIVWVKPSWHCGPFSEYDRIYQILTKNIYKILPRSLNFALEYIASPAIIIPLLVLLTLIIYYLISLTNSLREANNDLKIQLRRERTEERRKMFQIADNRRTGTSAIENTPFARWKKAMPSLPFSKSIDSDDRKTITGEDVNETQKNIKKKGGIFAKIVSMALDTKVGLQLGSDSNVHAASTSETVDDETDTDFHESLPKEVLKIKDITIAGKEKEKKKIEFKTDPDFFDKTRNKFDDHNLKVLIEREDLFSEKNVMAERQKHDRDKITTKIIPAVEKTDSKTGKLFEKDNLKVAPLSTQNEPYGTVIPVITISTTESDDEVNNTNRDKEKDKRIEKKPSDDGNSSLDRSGGSKKVDSEHKSLRRQSSVDSSNDIKLPKNSEDGHKYQYSL